MFVVTVEGISEEGNSESVIDTYGFHGNIFLDNLDRRCYSWKMTMKTSDLIKIVII